MAISGGIKETVSGLWAMGLHSRRGTLLSIIDDQCSMLNGQ